MDGHPQPCSTPSVSSWACVSTTGHTELPAWSGVQGGSGRAVPPAAVVCLVDRKLGWNSWTDSVLTSVMGQQL